MKKEKRIYSDSENFMNTLKLAMRILPYAENFTNVAEVAQNAKHFRTETVTCLILTLTNSGSVMWVNKCLHSWEFGTLNIQIEVGWQKIIFLSPSTFLPIPILSLNF